MHTMARSTLTCSRSCDTDRTSMRGYDCCGWQHGEQKKQGPWCVKVSGSHAVVEE